MHYNLICIFICTPICTKFYSCKKWVLHNLNLTELGWEPMQLGHMDLPFFEEEVESASTPPCGFWRIDDRQLEV
jgi:hypothetical protein